ncbi:MAG: hypothetical protein FH748_08855 [Balneolaceae bacterium]|nr:hypothetical protein [Balneolaceae bacterium]
MKKLLLLSSCLIIGLFGCVSSQQESSKAITNPAESNSSFPRLTTDNTGTVFMSWVEEKDNIATLKYASFQEQSWKSAEEIASDSSWFVNWADFPTIVSQNGKPMAVHWLKKVPGNAYSYNIKLTSYSNTWSAPMNLHEDNTATEHGFVSMTPAGDSKILATWLDGRNTANRKQDEYSDMSKAMTLRAAFVDKDSPEIIEKFELDSSVCDCCNTAITDTDDGYLVIYRNRTSEEIRDIYYTKYSNGTWTNPQPLNDDGWHIAGCPVNGPAVDSNGQDVAASWFTGANGKAMVKMALSNDNGTTFGSPIIVDDVSPTGRVDLNYSDSKIWVSWLGEYEDEAALMIRSYAPDGTPLNTHYLTDISKKRSAGFPQITPYKNGLMIAYTDVSGEQPVVRTKIIP